MLKLLILLILVFVGLGFFSCSKPSVEGKWQLFYFGESPQCGEKAVVFDKNGLDKGSYMDLQKDGVVKWYINQDVLESSGKWTREDAELMIEKNQEGVINRISSTQSELIYSLSNDRMVTYYPLRQNANYFFCWQRVK